MFGAKNGKRKKDRIKVIAKIERIGNMVYLVTKFQIML